MADSVLVYSILGAYLVINLLVGYLGFKGGSKSPDEYFLANRGVGWVVLSNFETRSKRKRPGFARPFFVSVVRVLTTH